MQLGKLRKDDPLGVSFLERHIIHKATEKEKQYKEMERKAKSKRGHRR